MREFRAEVSFKRGEKQAPEFGTMSETWVYYKKDIKILFYILWMYNE